VLRWHVQVRHCLLGLCRLSSKLALARRQHGGHCLYLQRGVERSRWRPVCSAVRCWTVCSNIFHSLLKRTNPFVVSDAVDWNIQTQRVDSLCGGTTCSGNTGVREAGTVGIGTGTGNGANVQVPYVGGDTGARLQWGAGSVPASFTICSVTRYAGTNKRRILNCMGSSAGDMNWLHGHWNAKAGSNHYNGDFHNNLQFCIPVNSGWVAMCGSNIADTSRPGIIVNNVVKAQGNGGSGSCALGINHAETSEWQFSKLYIWNYHLSVSDFAFVASELHNNILSNTKTPGNACETCPVNSQALQGSTSQSACQCHARYVASSCYCAEPTTTRGTGRLSASSAHPWRTTRCETHASSSYKFHEIS